MREGDWLVVRLSGPYTLEWFLGVIADIGKTMRAAPAAALLVDALGMFGAIEDLDRYRFAMATVEQQITAPIAFLGKEPILDPGRFGESVARNRGVNVRAVHQRSGSTGLVAGADGRLTRELTPVARLQRMTPARGIIQFQHATF